MITLDVEISGATRLECKIEADQIAKAWFGQRRHTVTREAVTASPPRDPGGPFHHVVVYRATFTYQLDEEAL